MRINSLTGIAVVLSLLISSGPSLAEVRQGNEVLVAKDEVIDDDLYVFAQKVTVNGTIKGDLIVFGRQIDINGSVDGDLIAAAQQVLVNGKVSDDARVAGQVLTLQNNADIADDLIAASYSLECTQASHIGGEVKYAGYQSVFAGRVEKKVELASANCELSGSFGDDIDAVVDGGNYGAAGLFGRELPTVPPGLTVTESADIAGNLNYQSAREAIINPDSTIAGEVEHSQIDSVEAQPPTIADRVVSFAKQFFALFLIGLLVVYLCPKWTERVVNNVGRRPLASLGWGVLTLIAVITGAILLLVATIAIAVLLGFASLDNLIPAWLLLAALSTAVVIVGFWIFSAWVAKVIVSVWVGNRIINGPDWVSRQRFLALASGVLIFAAASWIPAAGVVVSLVVMLMGIGSTAIWMFANSERLVRGKPCS
jgi:cytoskeletal protein CcmA (bactofilin family)